MTSGDGGPRAEYVVLLAAADVRLVSADGNGPLLTLDRIWSIRQAGRYLQSPFVASPLGSCRLMDRCRGGGGG